MTRLFKLIFVVIVIIASLFAPIHASRDGGPHGQRGGSSSSNRGGGHRGGSQQSGGAQHGGHGAGDRSGNSRVA